MQTSETIGATANEFDLDAGVWIIPAERMKGGREHRVPLSPRALSNASEMIERGAGAFVFAGRKPDKPMSNMAMLQLLKRMGREDITVHGFRSTFRDWAAECTNYPREVCDMALAHAIGRDVEAAYRRGDLFDKQCTLMLDWRSFCEQRSDNWKVIPMHKKISK